MNYSYRLKYQLKKKERKSENTNFCLFLPLCITEICLCDNMNACSFNKKICKIHSEVLQDTFTF